MVGPRGSAVERQSLASVLSPSCARHVAGERLQGKGWHGVLCRLKCVWSMPEPFKMVCIPCKALYNCSAFLPFYRSTHMVLNVAQSVISSAHKNAQAELMIRTEQLQVVCLSHCWCCMRSLHRVPAQVLSDASSEKLLLRSRKHCCVYWRCKDLLHGSNKFHTKLLCQKPTTGCSKSRRW